MKIDIKGGMDSKRGQRTYCTDNPYNPQKESFRWVSVSDLMSLKNILENYKYHTLKEIENIIGDSQDVFEISNRSGALLKIEDGLITDDDGIGNLLDENGNEGPSVFDAMYFDDKEDKYQIEMPKDGNYPYVVWYNR